MSLGIWTLHETNQVMQCSYLNPFDDISIYIYNSVLTRRHIHINSSASTPPNATKIAEMKDSQHGQVIVGPELLFSIYKCCFLEFVCAR